MAPLPEWCTQAHFSRYTGGQVSIINRYIDTSFHGQIDNLTLDESTGQLTINYAWFASGVDTNNRCSLKNRVAWVEDPDVIKRLDLWVGSGESGRMMLYTGRPVSDGRLILDGGELMEAIFTFLPPGITPLDRSVVMPADPQYPVDRTIRYVGGHMPGGTVFSDGTSIALYKSGADGDPHRIEMGDDGK